MNAEPYDAHHELMRVGLSGGWVSLCVVVAILLMTGCSTTPEPSSSPSETESLELLIQSGSASDIYQRANSYFDAGDYFTAFRLYEATLRRDADHLGAIVNAGVCARRMGDVDGAIRWYDRALEIAPDDTTTLQNRVVAGLLFGQISEILPLAQRLADLRPEDPASWDQLGSIHMRAIEFDAAAHAFARAVALDGRNPRTHYSLAIALAASNQYDRAAESFARALALNPEMREAYAPCVQVLMYSERYDAAWALVSQGQTVGAMFDPDLILELQRRSGRVGPG